MRTGRDREEAWPEFLELWEALCTESARPGTTVVVEGERDRTSLRRLGVAGPIELLHHGQRMSRVAEELTRGARRLIVLTDWDREGGHLAQRLSELMEAGPTAVDLEFRRRLSRLLRSEVVHVEGLAGWARRTAESIGAPLEHFLRPASA